MKTEIGFNLRLPSTSTKCTYPCRVYHKLIFSSQDECKHLVENGHFFFKSWQPLWLSVCFPLHQAPLERVPVLKEMVALQWWSLPLRVEPYRSKNIFDIAAFTAQSCTCIIIKCTYNIILSLPLIQEGQLSVTGERMGTKYWLTVLPWL